MKFLFKIIFWLGKMVGYSAVAVESMFITENERLLSIVKLYQDITPEEYNDIKLSKKTATLEFVFLKAVIKSLQLSTIENKDELVFFMGKYCQRARQRAHHRHWKRNTYFHKLWGELTFEELDMSRPMEIVHHLVECYQDQLCLAKKLDVELF